MQKLTAHHLNSLNSGQVQVSIKKFDGYLQFDFSVITNDINVDPSFSLDTLDNIGLWNFDVVEVFLRKGNPNGEYLEVQVSPLGQKYALKVISPRLETLPVQELDFHSTQRETSNGFEVSIKLSYAELPGEDGDIYGNVFACLGTPDNRCYYALNINKEETPDFHRPDLFLNLSKELL